MAKANPLTYKGACFINTYSTLSTIYDISREQENVEIWSEFIKKVLDEAKLSSGDLVLDCGCGTGDISILLTKQGFVVDAIDIASDMLISAKEKTHNLGLKVNYTLQDMRSFKFNNNFALITCINDGVNYLSSLNDVELFLENCHKHLKKDGYLLFDISTRFKLKNLDGQFFAEDDEEFAYIWFNSYNGEKHLLTMELTFFTQVEENLFARTSEVHIQRGHSIKEIESLLNKNNFKLINTYGDISSQKPNETSNRIHFLAQKV